MKEPKTFYYCERCNKAWETSPEATQQPKDRAMITVSAYNREGIRLSLKDGTAKYVSGVFCNIECLTKHLKSLLALKN